MVRLAAADTGPINYLILIGKIALLPRLFPSVSIPRAVEAELADDLAPLSVRRWIEKPPSWLQIMDTPAGLPVSGLHKREAAAIGLAVSVAADVVLLDDRRGVVAAERLGIRATGTLGVLVLAAGRGLIDFADAIQRLEATTFWKPTKLLHALLDKHKTR